MKTIHHRKSLMERVSALMRFDHQCQLRAASDPVATVNALIKTMDATIAEMRFELQKTANRARGLSSRLSALEDRAQIIRQSKEELIRRRRQSQSENEDSNVAATEISRPVSKEQGKVKKDTQPKQEGKY